MMPLPFLQTTQLAPLFMGPVLLLSVLGLDFGIRQVVQAARKSLRRCIGAMTAAQEEERPRLARELHDDTIQSLIALKQHIQGLRRQIRNLCPMYLEDLSLSHALEILAHNTQSLLQIPVATHRNGVERRLEPSVELAIYRMSGGSE